MSNYALRKTEGPFAAGTRVNVISDNNSDGTITVEVMCEPNETFFVDELVFDIEQEDLVQLRNRVDSCPVRSRKERRSVLKTLFGNTKEV